MRGPLFVTTLLLLAGCAAPTDPPGPSDPSGLDADPGGSGDLDAPSGPGGGAQAGGNGTTGGTGSASGGGTTGGQAFDNGTANGTAAPDWGAPDGKGIRPGINMEFQGAGCTTSFVFHQDWTRYFLATAAHCVGDDPSGSASGCNADVFPDAKATLRLDGGGSAKATIAYTSWGTMQRIDESNADACAANDFALLEIAPDDLDELHPASLHFEAPTGLATAATPTVYGYGASSLKFGLEVVHPKQGQHLGMANGGWSHHVYLATPGISGDSGGHIMTSDGKALGVASTIILSPTPASNHYTDIAKALAYMQEHEGWSPELVTWDGWDPSLL